MVVIFIILLILNIIGFLNRRKTWSKIFLMSQVFMFIGIGVTFSLYNQSSGLQARKKIKPNNFAISVDTLKGDPVSGCKLYKNGAQIAGAEQEAGVFPRVPTLFTRERSYIARSPIPSDKYINGDIYTFRMYNRELSSSEIFTNYQNTLTQLMNQDIVVDGLVLMLDGGYAGSFLTSSNTWFDVSGYNRNGALTNGPTFSSDGGGIILFDGVNDFVNNIGTASNFSFIQNTGIFTISAWVKLTDFSTARYFLGNNDGTTGAKGFYLGFNGSSGQLWLAITYGVSGQATLSAMRVNFFIDSNWVHVTCVGDGTSCQIYRNGSSFGSSNNFGTFSTGDSTRTLSVGRINNFNSSYWQGNVSQVSIYDRPLSASEVSQNFNAQKSRYGL